LAAEQKTSNTHSNQQDVITMKSLVVYYSRTGNAKFVAETIAATIGADTEEIIDLKKRGGPLGFISGGKDATQGKETEIAPTKRSPKDYDLIILGTPVWASAPTPAIRTYINQNDLAGQKIALFFTAGKENQKAIDKTKALLTNCQIINVLSLEEPSGKKEEAEKTIITWCETLK
jgi:flavodoxin